jgi:RNA polymerase sigma factor (sigma-70 family)
MRGTRAAEGTGMPNNTKSDSQLPKTATFLSSETQERGSDPPIPMERAADVWRDFEPLARKVITTSLRTLPLGLLRTQLETAGNPICRGLQTVRDRLAHDEELVADLVQDVALAFVRAVQRGAIDAARPVVYRWIETTSARIAREKSRADAITLLVGAHLSEDNTKDGEEPRSPEPIPTAGVLGRPLSEGEGPEALSDIRTELRELLFAAVPANLTCAQQLVFTRWVEGASHQQIARELAISEGAVRLRLMQARRRLAA